MMYLTTKNAGKNLRIPIKHFSFKPFNFELFFPPLVDINHPEFDRHELRIYEEVAKVPPFRRKTLVLIGAQGVGRRSLKNKLLVSDPLRYGTTVPCESRGSKTFTLLWQVLIKSERLYSIKNDFDSL